MGLYQQYQAYGGMGPACIGTGLSLAVLATLLIILRIYVRLRMNKLGTTALLWAIAAWVLTVVTQVFGVLAALHGLGNHMIVLLETDQAHNFLKFTWLTVVFFCIAIATGKAAVAVFLMALAGAAYPKIRWTLIVIAVVNFLVAIPVAIYSQFQCRPVGALWDPLRQDSCNTQAYVPLSYFIGAVAAFSDIVLALLPIYLLWSLQIDRKLKQILCVLLGLGVIAAAAAIVRTWASGFLEGEDESYHLGVLFLWGEVEEWLLIIAMSVPPTWPLFKPYWERITSKVSRDSSDWSGENDDHNRRNHISTDKVLQIRRERGFELTSEYRSSRDMNMSAYREIKENA